VNDFVDECREEWKRLGVPDIVAGEMAAELVADLEEAAAEGATAEDVLGGAVDPRELAAAWAAERGVIASRAPDAGRRRRAVRLPAAIAALAVLAIAGAVLVIASASNERPHGLPVPLAEAGPQLLPGPRVTAENVVVSPDGIWVSAGDPPGVIFNVGTDGSGDGARIVGSVLLSVALGAILLVTLWWWLIVPERWRRGGDEPPAGHAY
jgi:hypothetical protein